LATLCLFRDDSYLTEAAATVLEVQDRGGIILDKTVFYVTGGGQPGDSGVLKRAEGAPAHAQARLRLCTYKYLGHRNIQNTVRYTELSPARFKDFWRR
jgi:Ser-tRNA(Ala) deacylase AlaX